MTVTVNGGAGSGLDLGKILSLGLDAGYSYSWVPRYIKTSNIIANHEHIFSWSTSDATGTSATVSCPKGGITCGIRAIPKVVKTTGQSRTVIQGFSCPESSDWTDFEVVAPYQQGTGDSDDLRAVMDFSACLAECDGDDSDACEAAASAADLPACP